MSVFSGQELISEDKEGIESGAIQLKQNDRVIGKKKSHIATPDRYDAKYLLLMAMLTLGYMTERLRKSIETT